MIKRLMAVLLAGCVVASFTACGGSSSSAESTGSGETTTDEGSTAVTTQETDFDPAERVASSTNDGFQKYDEPVHFTAMTSIAADATSTNFEDSLWTAALLDNFNIELEYTTLAVGGEQYDQQVALALSSGDMPDFANLSLTQMSQAQSASLLADMTSAYYDWVSDQAYAAMTAGGDNPLRAATTDGMLYGIPWVQPALETCHALFYNQKWCDDLGIAAPTTFEDFEAMIYAFADYDADGDGSTANNFGLGLNKNLFDAGFEATSLANAMGAYPNAWVLNDAGEVVYGSVQPEMKAVLEKLHQYYEDGLIDPEFINKTFDDEGELVATSQLGAMFGVQWTGLMASLCTEVYYQNSDDPDSENWEAVAIPSAVEGQETSPIIYDNSSLWLCASAANEHPEAATIVCNYMHYMGKGPQGEGPEGHPELAIDYATWENMWNNDSYRLYSPETEHGNVDRWDMWTEALAAGADADTSKIDANYLAKDQYYRMKDFQEMGYSMVGQTNDVLGITHTETDAAWQFTYSLCGQTFMYAKDCQAKGNLTQDVQGAFVSTTMVEKQAALDDYEIQTFTKMITGETSTEEFDNFVETWKSMGGEQITTEMNAYYAEKHAE